MEDQTSINDIMKKTLSLLPQMQNETKEIAIESMIELINWKSLDQVVTSSDFVDLLEEELDTYRRRDYEEDELRFRLNLIFQLLLLSFKIHPSNK